MQKAEQIVAAIAVEDGSLTQTCRAFGEQCVDGRHKRPAARTWKAGRSAGHGIEARRIVDALGERHLEMTREEPRVVALVAAGVGGGQRNAPEGLAGIRERCGDEGGVDAARGRHGDGAKMIRPGAEHLPRNLAKLVRRLFERRQMALRQKVLHAPDRDRPRVLQARIEQCTGGKFVDGLQAGLTLSQFRTHEKCSQSMPADSGCDAASPVQQNCIGGEQDMGRCDRAIDRQQS